MLLGVALGLVVAVAPAIAVLGVVRRHGPPIAAKHQPLEQERYLAADGIGPLAPVGLEDGLDLVPERLVDDGRVLALVPLLLVLDLAQVDAIVEHLVDQALVDALSLSYPTALGEAARAFRRPFSLTHAAVADPNGDMDKVNHGYGIS